MRKKIYEELNDIEDFEENRSKIASAITTKELSKALIDDMTILEWEEIVLTILDIIGGERSDEQNGERLRKAIEQSHSIEELVKRKLTEIKMKNESVSLKDKFNLKINEKDI